MSTGAFSGADVAQLTALASRLELQASKLREIASSSTSALTIAAWTGANIDLIRSEWNRASKPQILAAARDCSDLSTFLRRQADEQAAASAASSGSLRTSMRLPDQTDGKVTVSERANPPDLGAPCSLGGIIKQVNQQYESEPGSGQVGIRTTVAADGTKSHIVLIPGTQDWQDGTDNPFNVRAAVAAGAGQQTDVALMVKEAMRQAGIAEGDAVMLIGHSLGGLEAGNLAADPEFRRQYKIQSVVAFGASIVNRDIPGPTSVLQYVTDSRNEPVVGASGIAGALTNGFKVPEKMRIIDAGLNTPHPLFGLLPSPDGKPTYLHQSQLYADLADGWGSDFGTLQDRKNWERENAGFLCAPGATTSYRAFTGVQV